MGRHDTWAVAEAKAKFSEVIDRARDQGPQTITRKGKRAVVVVSAEEWDRNVQHTDSGYSLFEALRPAQLEEGELDLARIRAAPRDLDL